MQAIEPALALDLRGDAWARGAQQAGLCPDQIDAVRSAVDSRLATQEQQLANPVVADFLAAQWEFVRVHDPQGLAETQGLAAGFGLAAQRLFAYLHLNIVADMAHSTSIRPPDADGCTAWAMRTPQAGGAWVVKNRDYRGEHGALQRVFAHHDPAWGGRTVLCVGSLGSPGAFSSGINSDGLAVVDTQIATSDHGVGWLRYFLMSHLLRCCQDVPTALQAIAAMPHAGGGSLVLGDAAGALAAVELGHSTSASERTGARWTVRTNHFTDSAMASAVLIPTPDDLSRSSSGRRARVCAALQDPQASIDIDAIRRLMAAHDEPGLAGLCGHANGDGSRTLSSAIYRTKIPSLMISHGAPCSAAWRSYALSDAFG